MFWIAWDQQFFIDNGLDLTTRKYDSGAASLAGVLNGEADILVGLTEFPVVRMAFEHHNIAIIGNADKGEFIYLVGRKDRGIENAADLRGKKVGTAFGTIAQFYLGRFLELNGIKAQELTIVDLKTPTDWVNAVVDGDIDAVVTAQPDVNTVKDRLGDNGIVLPVQSGQPLHSLIVTTEEWLAEHPGPVEKFLKSIARAEEYAVLRPEEAKSIIRYRLELAPGYMETVWAQNQFTLSLDLSLIAAMEDQARWLISNNLTEKRQVPDFMDYVYEDALKKIKPEAVNIIR